MLIINIVRKIFSFLTIVFLGAFLFTRNSFAQTPTPEPTPEPTPAITQGDGWIITPSQDEIDGNTPSVEVTFYGLEPNKQHNLCSKSKGCDKARDTESSDGNGDLTLTVCAANEDTLRVNDCDDKDYFHEGRLYTLTLFEDEDQEIRGPQAYFFINHYYPEVSAGSSGGPLEVSISGLRRPENNGNRNNYQIVLEGIDQYGNKVKDDRCITVKDGTATARFGREDNSESGSLRAGNYVVKVNEQINEGGLRKIPGIGDSCNGGFTYWHIFLKVDSNGNTTEQATCTDEGTFNTGKTCVKDPNASDIESLKKLLGDIFGDYSAINLPCSNRKFSRSNTGDFLVECLEVDTAIGSIPTNPQAFIERLFSIILSLAGVAALGLLIYGGYTFMVSRGDPERVKGARETIMSAVIGLLFIIFSLVLLQVIGAEILKIPGFGPTP